MILQPTKKLSIAAVRTEGCSLEYVPEKLKTKEVCIAAVRTEGCSLEYVPAELQAEMKERFKWTEGDNEAP